MADRDDVELGAALEPEGAVGVVGGPDNEEKGAARRVRVVAGLGVLVGLGRALAGEVVLRRHRHYPDLLCGRALLLALRRPRALSAAQHAACVVLLNA
jgi:hypothetical protein